VPLCNITFTVIFWNYICAQYISHITAYTSTILYYCIIFIVTLYYAICIIDMTEYNSNGIVSLKMSSEVLTKLGQGMLNCCLHFNLKMLWTRN
jgi:hypothetical protein